MLEVDVVRGDIASTCFDYSVGSSSCTIDGDEVTNSSRDREGSDGGGGAGGEFDCLGVGSYTLEVGEGVGARESQSSVGCGIGEEKVRICESTSGESSDIRCTTRDDDRARTRCSEVGAGCCPDGVGSVESVDIVPTTKCDGASAGTSG